MQLTEKEEKLLELIKQIKDPILASNFQFIIYDINLKAFKDLDGYMKYV